MPDFLYKARDAEGNLVQGTMVAESDGEMIDILQRRGLLITAVEQIVSQRKMQQVKLNIKSGIRLSHRVKNDDLCVFARQMGTLLNAGVPLLRR